MEELKIGPPGAGVITGKRFPFLEKKMKRCSFGMYSLHIFD